MITILGAGLSGISVAAHLGEKGIPFEIFEAKSHGGGHIYSENKDGFTWDEGPHVSFTKSEYVKKYFAENCENEVLEFATIPSNYYKGSWIPHPAQSNMYAVEEPLRSECIADLKAIRAELPEGYVPKNYLQWLNYAFGETFARTFPAVYTDKYWTTGAENLTTDWIGKRVYFPDIADMTGSAKAPLQKQTHYLTQFRYPQFDGFYSFIKKAEQSLAVVYNKEIKYISFSEKQLTFSDGTSSSYSKLVSTLPLPELMLNSDAPEKIKAAAKKLKCSQLLLINVVVAHPAPIDNQWIYVYDKDKYSTRINFTELLSPNNGQPGQSGIQIEVYFSAYRPLSASIAEIEKKVLKELVTMKLAQTAEAIVAYHSKWINWANVIFDTERRDAQNQVYQWLETKGLIRESDDLEPMTDWDARNALPQELGDIVFAGRFAQWKYYWTDDCVLRAKYISENLTLIP